MRTNASSFRWPAYAPTTGYYLTALQAEPTRYREVVLTSCLTSKFPDNPPPRDRQHNAHNQSNPTHNTIAKDDRCVEDDEDEETVPCRN